MVDLAPKWAKHAAILGLEMQLAQLQLNALSVPDGPTRQNVLNMVEAYRVRIRELGTM